MEIDLTRFVKSYTQIVPIVDGWGKRLGRRVEARVADGWYFVEFGGVPKVTRKAAALQVDRVLENFSFERFYALGDEGIATNFGNFKKKHFSEAVPVHFLQAEPFEVAKVVQWEDGRFYFFETDGRFQRSLLQQLKQAFQEEKNIESIKGVTPELQYYFLLMSLQRQTYRELTQLKNFSISEAEKQRRIQQFQNTFGETLRKVIEKAGGTLLHFYRANQHSYMVEWTLPGSDTVIKSTIGDNFRILNLGYCASGDDKAHNIESAIQLAKIYGDSIYITRE